MPNTEVIQVSAQEATQIHDLSATKGAYPDLDFESIVLENMVEGVSVANELGIIVYTNPMEDRMFGYSKGELLGNHVTAFNAYPEEDNQRKMQQVMDHCQKHGTWEGEFFNRRKDGATFYTAARIATMMRQGHVYFVCVQRDITAQKADAETSFKKERALQHSEERLRLATEAGNIGIWDWDVLADKLSWSDRVHTIYGVPQDQFGGRAEDFFKTLYPDDRPEMTRKFEYALAHSDSYVDDFRIVRPNREVRWVCNHTNICRDASGSPVRILGTVTDITERKQAEDALRRDSHRKDEFLAMLAHELRNPLAPISAAAQIIELAGQDGARLKEVSRVINRQVHHMVELVDDLLDVSRVTRGLINIDKDVQDIKSIVSTAVEQVTPAIEAARHHLNVDMTCETAHVLGDKKRLVQVLTNLLTNSAKYTPEGGNIRLSVHVHDGQVILNVDDDGKGVEPEMQEQIFELFAQAQRTPDRSQGGLGIGLALVKSLVELHDGKVSCLSEGLGKGSQFQVKLPRAIQTEGGRDEGESGQNNLISSPRLRVLVVDDNVDAASMLAILLEASGHHVLVEHSSCRALERARAEAPQVCLLDIGLPEMDGHELARRLRSQPETAKSMLVAITGYGQDHDREKALSAGFDHHLPKPVDTGKLATILAELSA